MLQVWVSTCRSLHCISAGGTHPPTGLRPQVLPARRTSALDNILLFSSDPHPSGEGMRKPTGKVLCGAPQRCSGRRAQMPGRRQKLSGSASPFLGSFFPESFQALGRRELLWGVIKDCFPRNSPTKCWVSSNDFPPDSQSGSAP